MNEYSCWCHVCGAHYIHRAIFMSGPTRVSAGNVTYLVRCCDEHQKEPGLIRRSYLHYIQTGKSLPDQTAAREQQINKQMGVLS